MGCGLGAGDTAWGVESTTFPSPTSITRATSSAAANLQRIKIHLPACLDSLVDGRLAAFDQKPIPSSDPNCIIITSLLLLCYSDFRRSHKTLFMADSSLSDQVFKEGGADWTSRIRHQFTRPVRSGLNGVEWCNLPY